MKAWSALFLVLAVAASACVAPAAPEAPMENVTPTEAPMISATVSISPPPSSIIINEPLRLTWTIDTAAESVSTEIRYSLGPVTALDYPLSTNTQAGGAGTYSAVITTSRIGKIYARAHALIDGQDVWSDEVVIDVVPIPATVKVKTFPLRALQNEEANITWEVAGGLTGVVTQTLIRWGYAAGDEAADYPIVSAIQSGNTPQTFSTNIKLTRVGTTYLRAFATVDDVEYKSDEFIITVAGGY